MNVCRKLVDFVESEFVTDVDVSSTLLNVFLTLVPVCSRLQ